MSKTYGSILRLAVPASLALGLILGSAQSLAQSSAPATTVTKPAAQATETKPATPSKDIDFTQSGYPDFIAEVTGLSGHEPWGRWSEGDKATFRFKERLPKKFTLVLTAQAFGPNVGVPIKVKAGTREQTLTLTQEPHPDKLTFTRVTKADRLEFQIPQPTSPQELKVNEDTRKLGIGFIKLQIVP